MKTIAIILSLLTINAFAYGYKQNTANFRISSFANDGSRVFYACDSVESYVMSMLQTLGAKKISVRCSGGLNPWGGMATEAYVRASFEAISSKVDGTLSTAVFSERIQERTNCHLNKEIFNGVKKHFELIDSDVRSCFRTNDRTFIDVELIKETE